MIINNVDLKSLGMKQLTVDIQSMDIVNNSVWNKNSISPIFIKNKRGFKSITVTLLVRGDSRQNVLNVIGAAISKLNNQSQNVIELDGYDHNFICSLKNTRISKTKVSKRYNLELKFIGYEEDKTESIYYLNRISTQTINVKGNIETPVVLEVTPSVDINTISINGLGEEIKINNLHAQKKIIIDGINFKVTEGANNKFDDVDIWEYPYLKSGSQTVECSKTLCDIKIKCKGRYI